MKAYEPRWRKISFCCNACETLFQLEVQTNKNVSKVTCPLCQSKEVTRRFSYVKPEV